MPNTPAEPPWDMDPDKLLEAPPRALAAVKMLADAWIQSGALALAPDPRLLVLVSAAATARLAQQMGLDVEKLVRLVRTTYSIASAHRSLGEMVASIFGGKKGGD